MIKTFTLLLTLFACNVVYGYEVGQCYYINPRIEDAYYYKIVEKYEFGVLMDRTDGLSQYFAFETLDRLRKKDAAKFRHLAQIDCVEYDRLRKQQEGK